jgi:plastocyanin
MVGGRASWGFLCALALLALSPGALPAEPQADGHGALHGSVKVLRKRFFGKPAPVEDRSGVIVYLTGLAAQATREHVAELDQRREAFHPNLLPIVRGGTVRFPNHDPIYHNVFSVSPVERFDLGQYKASDPPRSVVFDQPGLVPVFCNIHPHMIAYVVVLENEAYALTQDDGRFAIEGVPPGRYTANAWTPGAQRVSQEVDVRAGAATELVLELVAARVPPHKRKDGSEYPPPGREAAQ